MANDDEQRTEEHTRESAVELYDSCIADLRAISDKLGEIGAAHPVAGLIKRALDKALRFAPTFPNAEG